MTTSTDIFQKENIPFENAIIGNIPCTVGYVKRFRWRWLATQLNTFIMIGEANKEIDQSLIEDFSSSCLAYALKNNKGWPRGLQSGVGAIAILTGDTVHPDAIRFCEKPLKKHWSAFEIPVVCDTKEKIVSRYTNTPIWGRIYFAFFTEIIDAMTKDWKL